MTLTQEERVALEIVRRFRNVPSSEDESTPRHIILDAILRLFPADDDEPITDEWVHATWPDSLDGKAIIIQDPQVILSLDDGAWSVFLVSVSCVGLEDSELLRDVATRGDVRRFLIGMGVAMKSEKQD